ncbi:MULTISPECIES: DUF1178 family protein [unclassified Roseitalea]|uniref:DUF1178 family protein n=1 Tax=unclassified Roseitalea TaxID=2639107 RepID=UPI00273D032D|nr:MULTISPECIES: DUF1178 family protein [unclassified Roseitalea]
MKFTLHCDNAHDFEAWFRSNDDYETQARRGFVECPVCGSNQVQKALMAPAIATGRAKDERKQAIMVAAGKAMQRELMQKMREITRQVKDNADNVGARFPEEARKMHYGETDAKPIYGTATTDEVESLVDEGVEIMPLVDLPEEQN